jgi:hypothetical protein
MAFSSNEHMLQARDDEGTEPVSISMFPGNGQFETVEQIRGFELLRLAFFALKLRKLEQRHEQMVNDPEFDFRLNLLRHVIFQQVVTLTRLEARDQALQLIETCRK